MHFTFRKRVWVNIENSLRFGGIKKAHPINRVRFFEVMGLHAQNLKFNV